jgi:transposase
MTSAPIRDMNERAAAYVRNGMSIEDAIKQTVQDYITQLRGTGYRILSMEEIEQSSRGKFFEGLR